MGVRTASTITASGMKSGLLESLCGGKLAAGSLPDDYLLTGLAAGVVTGVAGLRHESPLVRVGGQAQAEDAERVRDPDLAVGLGRDEVPQARAAGPDHELAHPGGIGRPVGVLRGKALVVVVVAAEQQLDAVVAQRAEEGGRRGAGAVLVAGAE